jgi:hypothetical protein
VRGTVKVMALLFVIYFFLLPLIPGFREALDRLRNVNPALLLAGLALELLALFTYSVLTRIALGPQLIGQWRIFRIQLATRAIASTMPGGSAAGSALGFRLLTQSRVDGSDAGFALATVGLGSAVVLNLILLVGLVISIPIRGVNPLYGVAAAVGILLIGFAAGVVVSLLKGQEVAERFVRSAARRLHWDENRSVSAVRQVAGRLRDLLANRELKLKVAGWATANWLLDMAALWVFLRAFGGTVQVDGLIVAFCLANVLAVIPILPGGLGVVEGTLITTLVGFGLTRGVATLGVVSYRAAQFWLPIPLGLIAYLTLRVGPFSIERRDALRRLRQVAEEARRDDDTNPIDWAEQITRPSTADPRP